MTTQVKWYQKKYSPTHTYHDHQPSFIIIIIIIIIQFLTHHVLVS